MSNHHNWQPIATAPKDGGQKLLYDARTGAVAGGGWDFKYEQWWSWAGNDSGGPRLVPTHWKPLPKPPERE